MIHLNYYLIIRGCWNAKLEKTPSGCNLTIISCGQSTECSCVMLAGNIVELDSSTRISKPTMIWIGCIVAFNQCNNMRTRFFQVNLYAATILILSDYSWTIITCNACTQVNSCCTNLTVCCSRVYSRLALTRMLWNSIQIYWALDYIMQCTLWLKMISLTPCNTI